MALSSKLTDAEIRAHETRNPRKVICDQSGCRNIAVEVVGFIRELNRGFVVCAEHLKKLAVDIENTRGVR